MVVMSYDRGNGHIDPEDFAVVYTDGSYSVHPASTVLCTDNGNGSGIYSDCPYVVLRYAFPEYVDFSRGYLERILKESVERVTTKHPILTLEELTFILDGGMFKFVGAQNHASNNVQ